MSGTSGPATLDVGTEVALAAAPYRGGRLRAAAARLLGQRVACGALCILVLLHVVVFVGPLIWRVSPDSADPLAALAGLEAQHPLGADDLGRDELSRMLAGGQVTLVVGLVAMAFLVIVGVAMGAAAAFVGGWVDAILMRLTDAMMAVPGFFFVLVALTVLPKTPIMVALVIGGASWMEVTRVIYGETLRWKAREFVDAAYALGVPRWRILLRHILPHTAPAIIVSATLGVAYAILTESAISYLGLGIQPPTPSWGYMLKDAQGYIWTDPLLALLPGVAISLVVLAYNLMGDGLRDMLDPRRS
jgi:peptide/nickel transport system permease protein